MVISVPIQGTPYSPSRFHRSCPGTKIAWTLAALDYLGVTDPFTQHQSSSNCPNTGQDLTTPDKI